MKNYKKVGQEIILKAGDYLLNEIGMVKKIADKADGADLVTTADKGAEELIVTLLHKKFPKHSIFSEESGDVYGGSDLKWVIDPLDGTKHYIKGLPFFAVSMVLRNSEGPLLALTHIPKTAELFVAVKDNGITYNGKQCFVSKEKDLANAIIYVEFPSTKFKIDWKKDDYDAGWAKYEKLTRSCFRTRAYGSGPIGMAYTAMGGFDAYVRFQPLSYEDVLAGSLMIAEAGGVVTDQDNSKIRIDGHDLKARVVASNGKIHDQILKIIS